MIFPSPLSNDNEILCFKKSNSKTAGKLRHFEAVYLYINAGSRHQKQNRNKITPIRLIQRMSLRRVMPMHISALQDHPSQTRPYCIYPLADQFIGGQLRRQRGRGIHMDPCWKEHHEQNRKDFDPCQVWISGE